ncbi:unnamed protein product, partial [Prorocentrum cordatum]
QCSPASGPRPSGAWSRLPAALSCHLRAAARLACTCALLVAGGGRARRRTARSRREARGLRRGGLRGGLRLRASGGGGGSRDDWCEATPGPGLSATEVVELQLRALQDNDPLTNDGLAKTFEFASAGNQAQTGPLLRFAAMIRNGYPVLLNSASFSILSALPIGNVTYAVRVEVVGNGDTGGSVRRFMWTLSNVGSGWRTDSVILDEDNQ